jgi:hypothetical protein
MFFNKANLHHREQAYIGIKQAIELTKLDVLSKAVNVINRTPAPGDVARGERWC